MNVLVTILKFVVAALIAFGAGALVGRWYRRPAFQRYLRKHFGSIDVSTLTVTEREFPARVRADLQQTLDQYLAAHATINAVLGVAMNDSSMFGMSLAGLLTHDVTAGAVPLQYDELDVGEAQPARCLSGGLWLLASGANKYAVLLSKIINFHGPPKIRIDVAAPHNPAGAAFSQGLFHALEEAVKQARSYRGKVLSLEATEEYTGQDSGLRVHKLPVVKRDEVILPPATLALLERNVLQFVKQRPRLLELGQSGRKGLLFFGSPGNGKTHTIHYLINELVGHTTLLVSGEQVAALAEYMALARLLAPSIVVLEDVDLIARERTQAGSPCQESLLNKLLNEMDGLKPDAEILFVLTTNRPEALEEALSARPGRIDQAIEFPPPDAQGRGKLARLYSQAVQISDEIIEGLVERTDGVSAAFIKELMRRTLQNYVAKGSAATVEFEDVENALDELVLSSGRLSRRILGFGESAANDGECRVSPAKSAPVARKL